MSKLTELKERYTRGEIGESEFERELEREIEQDDTIYEEDEDESAGIDPHRLVRAAAFGALAVVALFLTIITKGKILMVLLPFVVVGIFAYILLSVMA